ncbi:transglutaminase-like domain-containing protein [Geomobilimonas luticola]|uniref:Transglutaminase-like domain-containing protein n=1 Tax=Geomobilimonas luticola TaxID=1114878 RepID=A0ABS5S9U3_9BACT|nr:transglutaminase-like domain-containing protein [Geomobilimonas luticola]MBT0652153.1 transglutaminase-like domain-containing protein [Geomobilimonas luticola]
MKACRRSLFLSFFVSCVLLHLSITAFAGPTPSLTQLPLGVRWFSISMNGERTGFSRLAIDSVPEGYSISGEGSVKMLVLGFSREASSQENYRVTRDLALKSFSVSQTIDGSHMQVTGERTTRGVKVTVDTAGSRKEKLLKTKVPVYPMAALNLLPLLRGTPPGKTIQVSVLDVEAVKVKSVEIRVIGREPLPAGGMATHLRNDLYPFVDNDVWVDDAGNTVRESVRNDLIVTEAEDAASAARFLAEAAVAKRDLVLDFSLIKVATPIERPADVRQLVVELSPLPAGFILPAGAGQTVVRGDEGRAVVTVERGAGTAGEKNGTEDHSPYLQETGRILSNSREIKDLLPGIIGSEQSPRGKLDWLVRWVAANVDEAVTDSFSPLETLASRKGNCQSHARLYASLARAAGIPTRFVSGLVYVSGKGFLYHSWAESFAGGWVAVDPTFGQVPADVTHIKLVEGDSPEEMAAIAGLVGKISARVVEQRY